MVTFWLLFLFGISLISFSCLITVTKASNVIFNTSGDSELFCLCLDFKGNILSLTIKNDTDRGFVIDGHYSLEKVSFQPFSIEGFYHTCMLDIVKSFLCVD